MHHGALLVGAEVQRPPYLTRRPSLDIAQDDDLSWRCWQLGDGRTSLLQRLGRWTRTP